MASSLAAAGTLTTALAPGATAARERSDRALVAAALDGDATAVDALFHRHWPSAFRVALLIAHDHAAAEDVAQEAFVAAVGRLEQFDRRRPFGPWLTKIAANRAIDWTRARGRRREVALSSEPAGAATRQVASSTLDEAAHTAATAVPAATAPTADALSAELLAALAALPLDQRAVVVLRHLLEWTPGEIARALELPRGTVNSRLRRGLDALRTTLGEEVAT